MKQVAGQMSIFDMPTEATKKDSCDGCDVHFGSIACFRKLGYIWDPVNRFAKDIDRLDGVHRQLRRMGGKMTNREAIKAMQDELDCINDKCSGSPDECHECMRGITGNNEESVYQLAIAALEKQEAKESPHKTPVMAKAFDGEGKALTYECVSCPNCKKWLSIFGIGKSYCPYCGQAVKSRQYNEQM